MAHVLHVLVLLGLTVCGVAAATTTGERLRIPGLGLAAAVNASLLLLVASAALSSVYV